MRDSTEHGPCRSSCEVHKGEDSVSSRQLHRHEDYDSAIYAIIDEEAQAYFAGSRSLDDTVTIIQNRVQLYIDEKR